MWKKIITKSQVSVDNKINQLVKEMELIPEDMNPIGLMSGSTGKALFFAYYGKYSNNEHYIEKSSDILFKIIDTINRTQNFNPLFSSGITGVLWTIQHLVKSDFIECDFKTLFGDINEYLSAQMMFLLEADSNYDFLHGSLGIANYLIPNQEMDNVSQSYIKKLENIGIQNSDSIYWYSVIRNIRNEDERVINLGLSHGISSIIAYLNRYLTIVGKMDWVVLLLKKCINFIRANAQDIRSFRSFFPNWISNDPEVKNSSLRWCYGDLGIAYTLYKSSLLLEDEELQKYSTEILLHTCERRNFMKEGISNAGLCHGSLGIAHIYNRLFNSSGHTNFRDAADYWYAVGLNSATKNEGIAGFMSHNKNSGWSKDLSFIEGVSGVGLALIASVSEQEPKWDECLLLS